MSRVGCAALPPRHTIQEEASHARDPRVLPPPTRAGRPDPPGQYDVGNGWPVLTAEVTPRIDRESWTVGVDGLVDQPDDVDVGRGAAAAEVVVQR